jgi:hypothetical protein
MKTRIILILLSFIYFNCKGQEPWQELWQVMSTEMEYELLKGIKPSSDLYLKSDIEGSPFLSEEFTDGSLITTDSLMYNNIPLRYNIYNDEMEFLHKTPGAVPMVITNQRRFIYFILDEKVFVYTAFLQNNKPGSGYFEILNEGNFQVLLRRNIVFAEEEKPQGYNYTKPARFEAKNHQYYFRVNKQIPEEFNLRRNNILEMFSNKKTEIEQFVKENRLSYRDINNVIRITDYYNQLIDN